MGVNIWKAMAAAQEREGVESFDLTPLIQSGLEKSASKNGKKEVRGEDEKKKHTPTRSDMNISTP